MDDVYKKQFHKLKILDGKETVLNYMDDLFEKIMGRKIILTQIRGEFFIYT